MPAAKPKRSVPKFSAMEIKRANACAVFMWNGVSYEDWKEVTSDRELLVYFSHEFAQLGTNAAQSFSLSRSALHDLIISATLKIMYRRKNELTYPNLEDYLSQNYLRAMTSAQMSKTTSDKLFHASQLVKEAGRAVVKPNVSKKAGYRISFLSWLLLFSAPQLLIFNYSNKLGEKAMNFQSRPHYAYPDYALEMVEGLRRNWIELSKYNIPTRTSNKVDADIKLAYKTHWWARRVLDIALLIRFGVRVPMMGVIAEAGKLPYCHQKRVKVAIP